MDASSCLESIDAKGEKNTLKEQNLRNHTIPLQNNKSELGKNWLKE